MNKHFKVLMVAVCALAMVGVFALVGCTSSSSSSAASASGSASAASASASAASASASAASASASAASASSSAAAATMVKDMKGDDAVAAGSAKSVLTVNSVATQMVLMCGGEKAAATLGSGFQYGDDSLNKKMFPNLGGLKTFTRDDATVENVAAIDPGLVVIDVPDTVTKLREANIPTAFVSVVSPETIIQAIDIIGEALGGDAAKVSEKYAEYYNGVLKDMAAKSANVTDKPRVIYLRNETKTIGEGSMPDNWITTLGGINVGAELGAKGGAGSDVTTEAIIGANPDIIVCEKADLKETLMNDAQYADITAVKNGAVYVAPLGTAVWSMGTAEAPLMVYWASQYINADLYKDIDVDQKTTEFFKQFYGYDLSKAELDTIFSR